MKRLAILGSTGSIGTQALEVVAAHPDLFEVEVLSAHSNASLLIEQAKKFKPNAVVVTNEAKYKEVKEALLMLPIKVFSGNDSLNEVVQWQAIDTVLGAILGFAGLSSILAAIDAGKRIALANKETLVVAGELVMQRAREKGVAVIPVDSEHSAIFQCMVGEDLNAVEKMILTASGGPFLGRKPNYLVNVKASHAIQHPNWSMGAKISIDSATLMNKGLEMIEAKWLFGLRNAVPAVNKKFQPTPTKNIDNKKFITSTPASAIATHVRLSTTPAAKIGVSPKRLISRPVKNPGANMPMIDSAS